MKAEYEVGKLKITIEGAEKQVLDFSGQIIDFCSKHGTCYARIKL